jgi:hypothetical protein
MMLLLVSEDWKLAAMSCSDQGWMESLIQRDSAMPPWYRHTFEVRYL